MPTARLLPGWWWEPRREIITGTKGNLVTMTTYPYPIENPTDDRPEWFRRWLFTDPIRWVERRGMRGTRRWVTNRVARVVRRGQRFLINRWNVLQPDYEPQFEKVAWLDPLAPTTRVAELASKNPPPNNFGFSTELSDLSDWLVEVDPMTWDDGPPKHLSEWAERRYDRVVSAQVAKGIGET